MPKSKKRASTKRKSAKHSSVSKRPSPSVHANEHKWTILEGNDGNNWQSRPNKDNVFRWVKINENVPSAWQYFKQISKVPIVDKYDKEDFLKKFKSAAQELRRNHVHFIHIPWNATYEFFGEDAAHKAAEIVLNKEHLSKKTSINKVRPSQNRAAILQREGSLGR